MKAHLHHIAITNFKAFRDFSLGLEGRHLLLYGANGAGKSSLYWALYTFLQSARKTKADVEKYFDPANPQNLLNLHEQKEPTPKPGEIALTLRETAQGNDTIYRISQTNHGTGNQPAILKGDLASDFITYRFFFGFSHFRNSEKFDLWPLFEKEILPFCVSTGGQSPYDMWQKIMSGRPNPSNQRSTAGRKAYDTFIQNTAQFANILPGIVVSISTEAQKFYDAHFATGDTSKIDLKLAVTTPPSAIGTSQSNFKFTPPVIEFGIKIDGHTVRKPQSFLNEAKLTQLALSVRFAASLVSLHDSDLKLLVLDDLLVSLDMSNRMQVVDILLSEAFCNYQKVILTHDLGFFREFRRRIGSQHTNWRFVRLKGNAARNIKAATEKSDLEKADDYLNGHDVEEAAMFLRKAAEDTAKRFREWVEGKELPPSQFFSLTENLRASRNKLLESIPTTLYNDVLKNTPEEHRTLLIPSDDSDLDNHTQLQAQDKGILKSKRRKLRSTLNHAGWTKMESVKAIDRVLETTERVLNPASHFNNMPLYEDEVRNAMQNIKQLLQALEAQQ
ncbi:DNA replication and repair protein RecF [Pseudomonas sp. MM221]|nr:DNA replication and repair protein RecF [Pseudomonas sp. MM223]CAI3792005.1 DNA replication and repair protein RecF [Pseudomonas sp. MM221]